MDKKAGREFGFPGPQVVWGSEGIMHTHISSFTELKAEQHTQTKVTNYFIYAYQISKIDVST